VLTNATTLVQILRGIATISTICLLICIYLHYRNRLAFLIFKQNIDRGSTLFSSNLLWSLLIELLLCAIHVPPFLDDFKVHFSDSIGGLIEIDVDLLLSCFIPLRIYLFIKYYTFYSSWGDDRALMGCSECNVSGGLTFAIKAELKEKPYTTVGILMVISIFVFGYILRNVEVCFMKDIPYDKFQDWRFIWNGFWCIIITILTVGYGDYYPRTSLGRVIAVVACLWGTFLVSMMVVSLTLSVDFSSQEEQAYVEIKKEIEYNELKKLAVLMIKKLNKLRNRCSIEGGFEDSPIAKAKFDKSLKDYNLTLKQFRKLRKSILKKENESSNETILHQLNVILSNDMSDLLNLSNHYIINLTEQMRLAKFFQKDIDSLLSTLEKVTFGLYKCLNK
jgi:hypothetical protein